MTVIAWTFCLMLATGACEPVEGAPTYSTEEACGDALIPWMIERLESYPAGTYVCGPVDWMKA